jgi:hypothetical protein
MRGSVLFGGALALAAGAALAQTPPSAPNRYIGEFCGPIVLNDGDAASLKANLVRWSVKAGDEADADAARPQDADAPGQLFRFPDPSAPTAFIERRRGTCTLIYPGAKAPAAVMDEMATEALPVNPSGPPIPWRKVTRVHFGPPLPPRYFLKVGEEDDFGLCTTLFEDLRLKDGSPATMARVTTCRLLPDEKLDNG